MRLAEHLIRIVAAYDDFMGQPNMEINVQTNPQWLELAEAIFSARRHIGRNYGFRLMKWWRNQQAKGTNEHIAC